MACGQRKQGQDGAPRVGRHHLLLGRSDIRRRTRRLRPALPPAPVEVNPDARIAAQRGYPAVLGCDNGPELACAAMAELGQ